MSLRMTEEEYAGLMARRHTGGITNKIIRALTYTDGKGHCVRPQLGVLPQPVPRSKYGNRRVEIDGLKFDSQHEADVYFGELLPGWKAGAYKLLARQVPFDLPGGIKYVADFVTVDTEGNVAVIDAKSAITRKNRVYINKKKQMRAIWGIEIQEV